MRRKKSTPKLKNSETIRHLHLESNEFSAHVADFEKWLRVFGFATSTIYYSPAYLRSFFHFLEQKEINSVDLVSNIQISMYMNHLSEVISERTNRKLSQSYKLNHLNAIK